jgi:hypothetical protein
VSSISAVRAASAFLFSEDQQIDGTPDSFIATTASSSVIVQNEWLARPLTRLDYVLMKMESRGAGIADVALELVKGRFADSGLGLPSADFNVGYAEEKGRIVLKLDLTAWGKPLEPMKSMCASALGAIEMSFPKTDGGYAWSNNALGILRQSSSQGSVYAKVANDLQANAVLVAVINTAYEAGGSRQLFTVWCRKQNPSTEAEYFKLSRPIDAK